MKKSIILVATLLAANIINAQEVINFDNAGLKVKKAEKILKTKPDFTKFVSAKKQLPIFDASFNTYGTADKTASITPSNTIVADEWGQIKVVETGLVENYQIKYKYGAGANVTYKFLDANLNETKSFNISIPTTANHVTMINTMSKTGEGRRVLMFVHYFEGGSGPAFQKSAIWVLNENGEKLTQFEASSAKFLKSSNGDIRIVTSIENDNNTTFKLYDTNYTELKTEAIATNLFYNYAGSPLSILKIKGEDKIVMSHYEKLFMDNDTFEVTPDNHLLVKIYDLNFNLEKTIPLDISSIYPDAPYIFALGDFGTLPFNYKFEITDKTFNDDEALEILYTIRYEDLINDNSWANYYVANEQGQRIKSLEKDIIGIMELTPITGQDDQLGFIIGEGDFGSAIETFNIQSWTNGFSFPASYNGQTLSANFNRIPNAGSYSYLAGLGQGKTIDNVAYGLINQYSATGVFEKEIKLNIGTNPQMFFPVLNSETLSPTIYNNDNDIEFSYIHKHKFPTGTKLYNEFSVSKDYQTPIFSVKGDGTYGDIISSGFVRDETESNIKKLAVLYRNNAYDVTTEFYDLPLTTLATTDIAKNKAKIYYDDKLQVIGSLEKADKFEVYNAVGNLVSVASNTNKVSAASFAKGLYIIKLTTNSVVTTSKVIVK